MWGSYILEIIVLSFIKPLINDFSLLAILATLVHVIFTIVILLSLDKKIRSIMVSGFIIRVLFLFFDLYGRGIFILPNSGSDSEGYFARAIEVSENMDLLGNSVVSIYSQITGVIIKFVGPQRMFVQYLNVLLGISTVYVIYLILRQIKVRNKIQKWVLAIASFMPNAIIMSAIFLREAFPAFFVAVSILYFMKWINFHKRSQMLVSLVSLGLASVFHSGVIGIILGLAFGFLFYDYRTQSFTFTRQTILYGLLLLIIIIFSMIFFDDYIFGKFRGIDNINDIYNKASGIGRGGSVYLSGIEVNNFLDFILYSPIKGLYFYLSPLPWDWRGLNDVFSFLIDSIVYFLIILFLFFNKSSTPKSKSLIFLFSLMIIGGGLVFGTGVDNAGTAMRHRQKLIPVFLMLLAILWESYSDFKLYRLKMRYNKILKSKKIKANNI